jgi:hypothetical protein
MGRNALRTIMLLSPHDGDSECICRSSNAKAATPSLRTIVDYIIDDAHIQIYIYIHMDMRCVGVRTTITAFQQSIVAEQH